MADSKPVTGSRDDLVMDSSRCLLMRFCESSCRRCAEICPHGAVTLIGSLVISPELCRGCLLCTAVCPVGALEQNNDFTAVCRQLSRVSGPLLGCPLTREKSNATLSCLGGLSEEHLLMLCHSLPGELTLNLTVCSGCRNNAIIPHLQQRLAILSERGLLDGGCRIVIAETATDICYQDEAVDRRSFFKFFRNSLYKSATALLSPTNKSNGQQSSYGGKRLPFRRDYLNRARINVSAELENGMRKQFDALVTIDDSCKKCQGCVASCPTGALLLNDGEKSPVFDQRLCTGCGLCVEFCLEEALQLYPEK